MDRSGSCSVPRWAGSGVANRVQHYRLSVLRSNDALRYSCRLAGRNEYASVVNPSDFWTLPHRQSSLVARIVSANYAVIAVEILIGMLLLPFNIKHLGSQMYGVWVLAGSVTSYFSMLDFGYGLGQQKFISRARALRDQDDINRVASTMFAVFAAIGLSCLVIAMVLASRLGGWFNLTSDEALMGGNVLRIVASLVALTFPFSVYGSVVTGFQQNYRNGVIDVVASVMAAIANVAAVWMGFGVVGIVAATTTVRILALFGFRANAYRVFPALQLRWRYVRLETLKQVTWFSAYVFILDLANRLNYSSDAIVIGIFMDMTAVATWSVAQRLIEAVQRVTGQISGALFPMVVEGSTTGEIERLRALLVQGTRLSLAAVVPLSVTLALLGRSVVNAWVGPRFSEAARLLIILGGAVAIRVGAGTASTILKGGDWHRLLTAAHVSSSVANVVLSIALIHKLGIIGVAIGTLIPVALASVFIVFPAACRRVRLPVSQVAAEAVWPAVWPIIPVSALIILVEPLSHGHLWAVMVISASALAAYAALFFWVALNRSNRHWYMERLTQLWSRSGAMAARS